MLTYLAAWFLNAGAEIGRTSYASHPSMVPAQNLLASDGWISVFVGNDDTWKRMAAAIGDPHLHDPAFQRSADRFARRARLAALLGELIGSRTTAEWVAVLTAQGVPCAPVNHLSEALASPPVLDRGLVRLARNRHYGEYRHAGGLIPALRSGQLAGGPVLGEHTAAILEEIGYQPTRIAALLEAGIVVGSPSAES